MELELGHWGDELMEIFRSLSDERIVHGEQGGIFIYPLKSEDIIRFCTRRGMTDDADIEEARFLIRQMDEEFLDFIAMKRAAKMASLK